MRLVPHRNVASATRNRQLLYAPDPNEDPFRMPLLPATDFAPFSTIAADENSLSCVILLISSGCVTSVAAT